MIDVKAHHKTEEGIGLLQVRISFVVLIVMVMAKSLGQNLMAHLNILIA